jgi:hypothetical protein
MKHRPAIRPTTRKRRIMAGRGSRCPDRTLARRTSVAGFVVSGDTGRDLGTFVIPHRQALAFYFITDIGDMEISVYRIR